MEVSRSPGPSLFGPPCKGPQLHEVVTAILCQRYPWFSTFLVFIYYISQKVSGSTPIPINIDTAWKTWCNCILLKFIFVSIVYFFEWKRRKIWGTFVRSAFCLAAMSEQLKYIVDELNKEPFKRNYNLIRYTSSKVFYYGKIDRVSRE